MKKIFLLIALIATNVNAVDWVELNPVTQLDADSIEYVNKSLNQREAWIKFISDSGEQNKARIIFDCRNLKTLETDIIEYDKSGKVKRALRPNAGWGNTAPDTHLRYTLETVCSYPYL